MPGGDRPARHLLIYTNRTASRSCAHLEKLCAAWATNSTAYEEPPDPWNFQEEPEDNDRPDSKRKTSGRAEDSRQISPAKQGLGIAPFFPPFSTTLIFLIYITAVDTSTLEDRPTLYNTFVSLLHPLRRREGSSPRPTLDKSPSEICYAFDVPQTSRIRIMTSGPQVLIEGPELRDYFTTQVQQDVSLLPAQRLTCWHNSYELTRKLGRKPVIVHARLTYSRGQLALTPCTRCERSYTDSNSALPFPDCVLLPTFWCFKCASCIATNDTVCCTFRVPNMEELDRNQTIWQLLPRPNRGIEHDLTMPHQEPSFMFPPEAPDVILPDGVPNIAASSSPRLGEMHRLNESLCTKRNIILITGAGISTNVGKLRPLQAVQPPRIRRLGLRFSEVG
ncbi:hypothetical protein AK830_g4443 [Neonectria ditissima]|uniref:Uncharacterized protein n=1 Tax=Neonectria ditissima TaxID=78410 RepID=A0A0P7BG37_9HYPO|nr:hypothetical protein AK830_g4443 [Neonectria ditissima]